MELNFFNIKPVSGALSNFNENIFEELSSANPVFSWLYFCTAV